MSRTQSVLSLAGILVITGCKSDGDAGETPSEEYSGPVMTVEVRVRDGVGGEAMPREGATVALDDADGNREEAVSDIDGIARVPIDWSAGPFAITADSGIRALELRTFLGLEEADLGEDEVFTVTFTGDGDEPDTVTLSGTASNRASPDSSLDIFNHNALLAARWQDDGSDYTIDVPVGTPFDLVVIESESESDEKTGTFTRTNYNWNLFSFDQGLDQDTVLDIDLTAAPQTPSSGSGSVAIPGAMQTETATLGGRVFPIESADELACGLISSLAPNAGEDGYEFSFEWLCPEGDLATSIFIFDSASDTQVLGYRLGTPDTWTDDLEFLPVPVVTSAPNGSQASDEPIEFETIPENASGVIVIFNDAKRLWTIFGDTDSSEIFIPAPPSSKPDNYGRRSGARLRPYIINYLEFDYDGALASFGESFDFS